MYVDVVDVGYGADARVQGRDSGHKSGLIADSVFERKGLVADPDLQMEGGGGGRSSRPGDKGGGGF